MTVTMEHAKGRKPSWDSKVSVSTTSNGTRKYRRSASSILSTDSDIRFTRRKLSSQYRCGCCIIASFLFLLLLASAAVYFGYTYFFSQLPQEQVYRASFKVTEGDRYITDMADPSTDIFKVRARDYRERLNLLFRRSYIRHGFSGTEILALDGVEGKDLTVHFNVHIDSTYIDVSSNVLKNLLTNEIAHRDSLYFRNLTIDERSVEVTENGTPIHSSTTAKPTTTESMATTKEPDPPRRCSRVDLSYCGKLPYNVTTYPNLYGHRNATMVRNQMISFREIVDAECFVHAYDFVCNTLQPPCRKGTAEDEMVLPCKSYCRDFMAGCGNRLPDGIKESIDCNKFPEFEGLGSCVLRPNASLPILNRELLGTAITEDLGIITVEPDRSSIAPTFQSSSSGDKS